MKLSSAIHARVESLAVFSSGNGAFASDRPLLRAGLVMMAAALFSASFASAYAVEPAGHITVARDVPAHDAFRPGDLGQPTNVATAHEDVVIATTSTIAGVPQTMSDAALGNIAGQPASRADAPPQNSGVIAVSVIAASGSVFGPGTALTAMPSGQAIGSAITAGTSTIGAAMSGLAGIK